MYRESNILKGNLFIIFFSHALFMEHGFNHHDLIHLCLDRYDKSWAHPSADVVGILHLFYESSLSSSLMPNAFNLVLKLNILQHPEKCELQLLHRYFWICITTIFKSRHANILNYERFTRQQHQASALLSIKCKRFFYFIFSQRCS